VAITVFILVMGGLMLLKNDRDNTVPPESSLVGNIHQQAKSYRIKVLDNTLPEKMTRTNTFKKFVDPRVTVDQFVKGSRPGHAKEFIQVSFQSLKKCYKQGCGQNPDEEDGFYDPALSIAQQSLKRVLEITAKYPKELEINKWIQEDDLLELLKAENLALRKAAFSNLVHLKGRKKAIERILAETRGIEDDAAGDAIAGILSELDAENKDALVDTIALMSKESSSATILGIFERIVDLKVSKDQIEQMAQGLCRFKEVKAERYNVTAMSYYLKTIAERSGLKINNPFSCP